MGVNFRTDDGIVHAQCYEAHTNYDQTVCGLFLVTNPRRRLHATNGNDLVEVYGPSRAGEKPDGNPDSIAECVTSRVTCVVCLGGQ